MSQRYEVFTGRLGVRSVAIPVRGDRELPPLRKQVITGPLGGRANRYPGLK